MQRINLLCRRIFLTKEDFLTVETFCQKIQDKQSQQGSRDIQRNDVGHYRILNGMIGKLGEVGASKLFGGTVDFRVWDTGRRGLDQFEPDLQNPKSPYRFHVKTCHIKHTVREGTNTYPLLTASWTIDQSDPVLHCPKKDDILVLMFASNKGSVHSLGYVKAIEVKDLWKPCVTATLSHKRALYIGDIWHSVKQTSNIQ
jgi:hypothetical protein